MPHWITRKRLRQGPLATGGFTLIELIVVVLVIGILATIGINMMQAREKAFVSAMQSDLYNVAGAESEFFLDNYTYTSTIGAGMGMGMSGLDYSLTEGVQLELFGDAAGFSGRTTHIAIDARCALFTGSPGTVYEPATEVGLMACDGDAIGGMGGGMGMGMGGP